MKIKSLAVLISILALSSALFAQDAAVPKTPKLPSAKKIVKKYEKAVGGKKAIKKLKTRYMKTIVEISPMGIKGTSESYSGAPNKSYSKSTIPGIGDLIESFDGTAGWSMNPLQGTRDKTGPELAQTKLISDFYRDINLRVLYPNMVVKGIEKVGAADTYVIVATPAGSSPETFYFDIKTGLLLRNDATLASPEGNAPVKIYFEDYRNIDGIMIAHKTRTVLPQAELINTIVEVKHNVPIDDSKFAKPKQ